MTIATSWHIFHYNFRKLINCNIIRNMSSIVFEIVISTRPLNIYRIYKAKWNSTVLRSRKVQTAQIASLTGHLQPAARRRNSS